MSGPKNKEINFLFDSKLSKSVVDELIKGIIVGFSINSLGNYAIVLRKAPKIELLHLAKSLEDRIVEIKEDEKIFWNNETYNIGKLRGFIPVVIIDLIDDTYEILQRSLDSLRKIDEKCFYIIIDENNKLKGNRNGFYPVDISYYLENQSS